MSTKFSIKRVAVVTGILLIPVLACAILIQGKLREPESLTFEEALWVEKGGRLYPPGSEVSRSVLEELEGYVDDNMEFTSYVLFFGDKVATGDSRDPLIYLPYFPPPEYYSDATENQANPKDRFGR